MLELLKTVFEPRYWVRYWKYSSLVDEKLNCYMDNGEQPELVAKDLVCLGGLFIFVELGMGFSGTLVYLTSTMAMPSRTTARRLRNYLADYNRGMIV